MLLSWFHRRPTPARSQTTYRPNVEVLEDRTVPTGDMVLRWNTIALQAVAADHSVSVPEQGGPTRSARALAIVQTAVFDAVNSIVGRFRPYLVDLRTRGNVSIDAAVATAARNTLAALYPRLRAVFHGAWRSSLAAIPNGIAEEQGVAVGRRVARAILAARRNDGSNLPMPYTFDSAPGKHQPDPLHPTQGIHAPGWVDVQPFVLRNVSAYLGPHFPAMGSPEYTAAYQEVKQLGGDGVTTPTTRTAEQTQIGIFWGYDGVPGLGTPPVLYNQIAQTLARKMRNSTIDNARLLALVNLALADAAVVAWGTKYRDNCWRPVIGIRRGEEDGNPATVSDANWTPLGAPGSNTTTGNFTPPFPAYTSGHATFGAALFRVLRNFYGRDNIPFTIGSDEFNGRTRDANGQIRPVVRRSYRSFSEAAEENGQSRIYLGIHWAFDKTNGMAQGTAVADYVFANALRQRR